MSDNQEGAALAMDRVVGILGGGQLGRMLAASASLLNIDVVVLDVGENTPAKQVVAPRAPHLTHIDGSFADSVKIRKLASKVDVLTVEIEHVDVGVLEEVESKVPLGVHPSPFTIKTIQDKLVQKQHLRASGCPVSDFLPVESNSASVHAAAERLGLPLMLKSRTLAYDGRGNFVISDLKQVQEAITALGNRPLYAEKWVPFVKEIAVMVVRSRSGDVLSYPVVETVHKQNICHLVFAPLRSADPAITVRARSVAENAVKTLQGAGVFGVEMFLMPDGSVYLNEIAPRPHNSGHYTIEACETSQYENHLRAILSLPLGSPALKVPSACMLNILGVSSSLDEIKAFAQYSLTVPGARVHLYGKSESRKGRKMGHITIVANSDADLSIRLRPLLAHLPGGHDPEELDLYAPLFPERGFSHKQPVVGVIMGSDSDLPVMLPAADILSHFKIPYELTIVSAHRTPDRLVEYARSAASRGLRVIIAGAGGAAHLPGMVAAMTPLPVIGVPVKGSSLDGVDSLHSIVQMPRGIPVATVAINNGTNAGLLAVRILSAGQPLLVSAMEDYLKTLEKEVLVKVDKIAEIGWDAYESSRKSRSS
ncbi:Phosphoribosylaminoimidazole carboxylase [Trametes punicea]|nr:Phosphoribosylaminoimidazole carboxylase [Trametes punicea]